MAAREVAKTLHIRRDPPHELPFVPEFPVLPDRDDSCDDRFLHAGKSVFSFFRSPLKTSFISAFFSFAPLSTTSFWCQRLLRGFTFLESCSKTIWQNRSP